MKSPWAVPNDPRIAEATADVVFTRTRRSLATQLRQALDDLAAKGWIRSWSSHYGEPHAKAYRVKVGGEERNMTPGEAADFVNEYGYDVAIGKP